MSERKVWGKVKWPPMDLKIFVASLHNICAEEKKGAKISNKLHFCHTVIGMLLPQSTFCHIMYRAQRPLWKNYISVVPLL